jgi:hypothetical protein
MTLPLPIEPSSSLNTAAPVHEKFEIFHKVFLNFIVTLAGAKLNNSDSPNSDVMRTVFLKEKFL